MAEQAIKFFAGADAALRAVESSAAFEAIMFIIGSLIVGAISAVMASN